MEALMRIWSFAFSFLLLSLLPLLAAKTPAFAAVERPWETALSAENVLWIPEPLDSSVSQIDLDAEMKSAALAIDEAFAGEEHDDLLGLAFPPEFGMGTDLVYVAFAYDSGTSGAAKDRRTRIVQYQWDAEVGTLSDPIELRSGLPAD
jgi:hypothetical protein